MKIEIRRLVRSIEFCKSKSGRQKNGGGSFNELPADTRHRSLVIFRFLPAMLAFGSFSSFGNNGSIGREDDAMPDSVQIH